MLLNFYSDLQSSICSWLQKAELNNLSQCSKECYVTVQPWLWSTLTVPYHFFLQPVLPEQLEMFCREISFVDEYRVSYGTQNHKNQVRDRIAHFLKSCHTLKVLKFEMSMKESTFTSEEILDSISHMENLKGVHLAVLDDSSHFDDAIHNFILSCPRTLRELSIEIFDYCGDLSTAYAKMYRLSALHELTIIHHTVPEDAFKVFCCLPLIKLRLEDCSLTDNHIQHVTLLQNIVELNLQGNRQISNTSLAHITCLNGLENLTLSRTGVCDWWGLQGPMPTLIHLKLKKLHISSIKMSDFLFERLSGLEHLTDLDVSSTEVKGNKLFHLKQLPICRLNLGQNSIRVGNMKQLHDFAHLQYLDLSQLHNNQDDPALVETLKILVTKLHPTLKMLNVTSTVTPAHSELIQEQNSSLHVIY